MTTGDPSHPNNPLEGPDAAHVANAERPEKVTQLILTHPEAT